MLLDCGSIIRPQTEGMFRLSCRMQMDDALTSCGPQDYPQMDIWN